MILTKVPKNDRLRQCLECILVYPYLFFSLSNEGEKVLFVSVNWIANFKKKTQCYLLINIMCNHAGIMFTRLMVICNVTNCGVVTCDMLTFKMTLIANTKHQV